MKLALYAFVSPLIVAAIVIGCVGLMVRGACYSFGIGYSMPEIAALRRAKLAQSKAPGGYQHGMD